METKNESSTSSANPLKIERIFNAARERVWKAWTDPEEIKRWWGPKNFTAPIAKNDFCVEGRYLLDMRSPDGKDFWSTGIYKEIVQLERIKLNDSFADENGNIVSASYYGMSGDFPRELSLELTFEDMDGKTKFTLNYPDLGRMSEKDRKDMEQGWNESFDKLEAVLQTPEAITPMI
jgi:uncharacterized protein YndB with AHSA1/START domain